MSALVIIMSIGTKPNFKREAVRDTAGIGTMGVTDDRAPHLRLAQGWKKMATFYSHHRPFVSCQFS